VAGTVGTAEGTDCATRPGGQNSCCTAQILTAAASCNSNQAPCVIQAKLCLGGNCGPPPPPKHAGWSGGDKGATKWAVPTLAPETPSQAGLAAPAATPDGSCLHWKQYSSEIHWRNPAYTQHIHSPPASQYPSTYIPISARNACGTVYPREGDAQDGMFPPGRHGNQEANKLQQLYYNTDIQPETYCFWGGQRVTTDYGINGQTPASTSYKQVCLGNNRETIGWPTKTTTYNLYGITSGLSTTSDFSTPLDLTGTLNEEYKTRGGVRLSRDPSAHSDYPHSAVDQSVHGANSGFTVHSGQKDQCHDLTLRQSCKTVCTWDSTNTHTLPDQKQCTPCSLAQQCAPSSPIHTWTTQVPASISRGHESTGGVYHSYPQGGLGTVDTGGAQAPGYVTYGDKRR